MPKPYPAVRAMLFTLLLVGCSAGGDSTDNAPSTNTGNDSGAGGAPQTDSGIPQTDSGAPRSRDGGGNQSPTPDAGDAMTANPDAGPPEPSFDVRATDVGARSVALQWPAVEGAQSVKIFVAPEPPAEWEEALPAQVQIASPSPSQTTHHVENLAPAVHFFFRVVVQGPDQTHAGNAYAKTLGGPNPAPENDRLDGPIREVRGVTPRMLDVVVAQTDVWLGGNDGRSDAEEIHGIEFDDPRGASFQSGTWNVERLGTDESLSVATVHRRSIPVGTPRGLHIVGADDDRTSVEQALEHGAAFPPRTWHQVRNRVVNIDHHMFLQFEEPMGTRGVFRITGPDGIEMLVPFSDRYLPTATVQLNQVGYSPRASRRYAYLSGFLGDGGWVQPDGLPEEVSVLQEPGHPLRPRETVPGHDSLAVSVRTGDDPDTEGPVMSVDLSELPADDSYYRVRIPGVGVSWRTTVSKWAPFKAFYVIARGVFLNRWGGDLAPEYTDWTRPPDHPYAYIPDDPLTEYTSKKSQAEVEAARAAARSDLSRRIELQGGHHDAGDFDQRPMHTRVAQFLMRLYEQNRDAFTDEQLTIPESGNGVPDILDEALWNVKAWRQLQTESGCVRMGAETYRHPPISFAHLDDLPYVTYACNPNTTARAAGLFAQASRLVEQWDASRAAELLDDARAAWDSATSQGAHDTFRMYAAGELARTTGEAQFRQEFESLASSWSGDIVGPYVPPAYDVDGGVPYPGFFTGYLQGSQASSGIRDRLLDTLGSRIDDVGGRFEALGHRNPRPASHNWGYGQGTVPMRSLNGVAVRRELGDVSEEQDQRLFDFLSMAADYVLGANPLGISFVTKLGTRYPQNPLWADSLAFQHVGDGHMPGYPIFGPFAGIPAYASDMAEAFHPGFGSLPSALQWADVSPVATWNEGAIWVTQAPLAHLFGLLIRDGMKPPASWKPSAVAGGEDHDNPLPF